MFGEASLQLQPARWGHGPQGSQGWPALAHTGLAAGHTAALRRRLALSFVHLEVGGKGGASASAFPKTDPHPGTPGPLPAPGVAPLEVGLSIPAASCLL